MKTKTNVLWGLLALAVVSTWGLTFISMKVASAHFTPAQVMLIRCIIAYLSLLIIHPKFYKIESLRQELIYFSAGLCGTTLYVILINSSYSFTQVANVSVLASLSPIFIALLTPLFFKGSRVSKIVFIGFAIAVIGTVCIVTDGKFALSLSFKGDSLALLAAIVWASYSLLLKKSATKLPQLYVTRRIFLYGIIAVIPVLLVQGTPIDWGALKQPSVLLNMLFLGLIAYTGCHVCIALVIKKMGPVWTSKFSYLEPVVTIIFSAIFLGEVITVYKIIGAALILLGVMVADGIFSKKKTNAENTVSASEN